MFLQVTFTACGSFHGLHFKASNLNSRAVFLKFSISQTPNHILMCGTSNILNNEQNNKRLAHERNTQMFQSRECTCKVLPENSVDTVDYYIIKDSTGISPLGLEVYVSLQLSILS